MLSGDLGYIDSDILEGIKDDIHEVERMLKALIKSLENKHLNPCTLESWTPFSITIRQKICTSYHRT